MTLSFSHVNMTFGTKHSNKTDNGQLKINNYCGSLKHIWAVKTQGGRIDVVYTK